MIRKIFDKYNAVFERVQTVAQDVFLLGVRISWGYGFFLAGKGKFENFERTTVFFNSLGIPFPELNVILAASTELLGGLLLLIGLGSRFVPIPLIFTMVVAYPTAHKNELLSLWSEKSTFTEAEPFLYLLAALIVLCFGAGRVSVDFLLFKKK
jgi:putative oxidoreductase